MNIVKATEEYEIWLGKHIVIDETTLAKKHVDMTLRPHVFLRATFYRWAQIWPEVCPQLAKAPTVLAVGDLHIENFGTWRDIDGRLIWGVNDFDETYPLPFTNDLVRLATSACIAMKESNDKKITPANVCTAILDGYRDCLLSGGKPFVLGMENRELRDMAYGKLRDPIVFWPKLFEQPPAKNYTDAVPALESLLPEKNIGYRVVSRVAGEGSLGRQRFVALAQWRGGPIAREAKALVPSACIFAIGDKKNQKQTFYEQIISRSVRCYDPFVHVRGKWIVRRLAPDCSKISLASLAEAMDQLLLIRSMGFETGNTHLSNPAMAGSILRYLKKLDSGWLLQAATKMSKAIHEEWQEWAQYMGKDKTFSKSPIAKATSKSKKSPAKKKKAGKAKKHKSAGKKRKAKK